MRIGTLIDFYRWRLRNHGVQELLAASGIGVGVALTFGVLLANTAINNSAGEFDRQLLGSARLQLVARSPAGFDERIAEEAVGLPGVRVASPVLRESATIVGPRGRQLVQLLGLTPSIAALGGSAARNLGAGTSPLVRGIGLAEAPANAIGVRGTERVGLLANGEAHRVQLRVALDSQAVGALASGSIAIAPLPVAQRLTGRRGRVTSVLIEPAPGAERRVKAELNRLAGGRLDVVPADNELRLLAVTAAPTDQSTTLFAVISALVGFLLAVNAMLLTIPERRRFVAELRLNGFDPPQVIAVLLTQALALGLFASVAGIAGGYLLSHTLFHQVPNFITFAYPVGSQQAVRIGTVLIALGCGIFAALIASLPPALDMRPSRPLDSALREPGEAGGRLAQAATLRLGALGVALVVAVTVIVLIVPSLTVLGGVILALAVVCLVPYVFALARRAITPLSERLRGSMLGLAVVELRAGATRSIALAGVAALAVYGSIAVGGAQNDLLHGLDQAIVQNWSTAQLWVTPDGNIFDVDSFHTETSASIVRAPGIASVRTHQAGFLDVGSNRLWIRAYPPENPAMILSSQLLKGDLARATALLRRGGWATVSSAFASQRHLRIGGYFTLPTPAGSARFGVAAITTNLGWPSGAITINTNDYSRDWETNDPTTIAIDLRSGVTLQNGKAAVERALGYPPGLRVQTSHERITEVESTVSQGLRSLGEIATLLLIAAALAVASALGSALWQRRGRFAALKISGYDELQLWRSLLLESALVLGIGCVDGLIMGLYGHAVASRWLRLTTGYPAPFALDLPHVALTLVIVSGIALLVVAIPGFSAAQVPVRVGFQE